MTTKTILILFGGCSSEYGVSLQSAHAVLTHLDGQKFTALPVGITRAGAWRLYTGPLNALPADTWHTDAAHCAPCALNPDRGSGELLLLDGSGKRLHFDAAFPVLHGKNGEDGTVQGLLELAGVPLVGCGTLASALGVEKDRAHNLAALAGVPAPQSAVFARGADPAAIADAAGALGWPLFVKPVRAGSSLGITRVGNAAALPAAVAQAFRYDDEIVLEQAVPGFEVGCAVMGDRELTVGLVDEIELAPAGEGYFDFAEKYTLKTSAIHCPARIPAAKAAEIQAAAKTVYRALGCRGFARVDLFLTPAGQVVFNEVNTIPGFTAHSRYPSMMKGIGLDFTALITKLIEAGLKV